MEKIGAISKEIVDLLQLDINPDTPIFIGESNVAHIISRHEYEYDRYFQYLSDIIKSPDYVGLNPKDNSIQYVKEFVVNSEFIRVAVRISHNKNCFVKTMHLLSTYNAERYIEKGTLKKLDKK